MTLTDLKAVSDLASINEELRSYATTPLCRRIFNGRSTMGSISSIHSTQNILTGHSDSVGGFVALTDEKDPEWIGFVQIRPVRSFHRLTRSWSFAERRRLPSAWRLTTKTVEWLRTFSPSTRRVQKV
jgi:hypothetical protein